MCGLFPLLQMIKLLLQQQQRLFKADTVTILNGYRKSGDVRSLGKKALSLRFKAEKTVQSKRCIYKVSVY